MQPVMLLGGLASVLAAAGLLMTVLLSMRGERLALGRSLAAVAATGVPERVTGVGLPFVERVLLPVLDRLAGVGRAVSPSGTTQRLTRWLDLAGNPAPWSLERLFAVKVVAAGGGAILCLWLSAGAPLPTLFMAVPAAIVGSFLPDVLVYNSGIKRQARIQLTLPDAIDLLTISVEAGLAFDAGIAQVARNTQGPLSGEFFRLLQEMQLGKSRAESLRALADRTTVPELRAFVSAMVQADTLGIPMGRVLREQAKEMRLKRRQRAEEQAMKVPVKILAPMVVFILPVIFVIVLAPAAFVLTQEFGG